MSNNYDLLDSDSGSLSTTLSGVKAMIKDQTAIIVHGFDTMNGKLETMNEKLETMNVTMTNGFADLAHNIRIQTAATNSLTAALHKLAANGGLPPHN